MRPLPMTSRSQDKSRQGAAHEGDCAVDLGDTAAAHYSPEPNINSERRPVARPGPRMLLACQDESIKVVLLTLFEALGPVFVQEATDGSQLDHLLSHEGPYDLVISQAALPGSRGLDVLAKARERGDGTPFILIQSLHHNFVRITMGGGPHSIVSTRLVNTVALLDLVRQIVIGGSGVRPRD